VQHGHHLVDAPDEGADGQSEASINRHGPDDSGRRSGHACRWVVAPGVMMRIGDHARSTAIGDQAFGSQVAEQLRRHGRGEVAHVLGDLRRIARADHRSCDGWVADNEPLTGA
jgi:hypothetical protein